MNTDRTDQLKAYVEGLMDDLVFDRIQAGRSTPLEITSKALQVLDFGTDDGSAYGTYQIVVNGRHVIQLKASGTYEGFEDCWDWSSDSHYTKPVTFDELQDCEYEVIKVTDTEKAIDSVGDQELNSRIGK